MDYRNSREYIYRSVVHKLSFRMAECIRYYLEDTYCDRYTDKLCEENRISNDNMTTNIKVVKTKKNLAYLDIL